MSQPIFKKEEIKSLNLLSPEFIPDTSFSSSNGENTLNNISTSELGGDSETSFTLNRSKTESAKKEDVKIIED